uniref:Uncharacterized protein n=1 Tax=Oryza sativa subsp. japonica TaxID=39947 RepID=Q6ERB8_ORYSJ|nr:hypothetical protein [Oryza sativa Japonica Group]
MHFHLSRRAGLRCHRLRLSAPSRSPTPPPNDVAVCHALARCSRLPRPRLAIRVRHASSDCDFNRSDHHCSRSCRTPSHLAVAILTSHPTPSPLPLDVTSDPHPPTLPPPLQPSMSSPLPPTPASSSANRCVVALRHQAASPTPLPCPPPWSADATATTASTTVSTTAAAVANCRRQPATL